MSDELLAAAARVKAAKQRLESLSETMTGQRMVMRELDAMQRAACDEYTAAMDDLNRAASA